MAATTSRQMWRLVGGFGNGCFGPVGATAPTAPVVGAVTTTTTTTTTTTAFRTYSSVPVPDEDSVDDDSRSSPSPARPSVFRSTFRAADVVFEPTSHTATRHNYVRNELLDQLRAKNKGSLGFGTFFSDHMLSVSFDGTSGGWSAPRISPLANLSVHPAAQVLHYGMSCFEGMKVYKDLSLGCEDRNLLFRPELNLSRFVDSARRLHLPSSFCPDELLELLKTLVRADAGWVPDRRGEALYLRPVLYAVSDMLGVAPPAAAALNVIMSPSGDYFGGGRGEQDGKPPIRLFVEEGYARAWAGGAGSAKVGGNYAPTIFPQWLARERYGVDQVVYTREGAVEECGAMNIFFVFENEGGGGVELVTPALGAGLQGTILPGVTRASILEIARAWNADTSCDVRVEERRVGVDEVAAMADAGRLREVFTCGTASVIQPVGGLVRRTRAGSDAVAEMVPRDSSFGPGSLTRKLYDTLVDIQHGLCDDPRFAPWAVPI